jgi:CRISPR/Cas system-associated exonuclease Cas4 (RecB family)
MSKIEAWSNSRLDTFESCPHRAYLQYVEKIPQPPLVIPEGKDEHPLTRGLRVHDAAEAFVKEDVLLIPELQSFEEQFLEARELFRTTPHNCIVEEDWAFNKEWKKTGWRSDDTWGRLKLDLGIIDDDYMDIVDYKTGKKYGPKHIQQGQLYAIVCFERFPQLQNVKTSFWYVDSGTTLDATYTRLQGRILRDGYDQRARVMTETTVFPAKPSSWTCRFCPYGEGKDGNKHCEYGYSYDN